MNISIFAILYINSAVSEGSIVLFTPLHVFDTYSLNKTYDWFIKYQVLLLS